MNIWNYHNKINNSLNLLKELSLNNVKNVNFGFKEIKDEIIWHEDENTSFDMFEEDHILNANVKYLNSTIN